MEISELQQGFQLADWQIRPALSEIEKDGEVVQLEPRVMAVLEQLATRPGEVVSRQELEDAVWGTVIGYDALAKAINKLRDALGDDRKKPRYIQTISKKGYRLVAPINKNQTNFSNSPSPNRPSKFYSVSLIGIFVVALLIVFAIVFWPTGESVTLKHRPVSASIQNKPTIVVLPFRNISASQKDDYLADGLTSDLTINLSKLSSLWVTASNATLVYKNGDVAPEKIRQDLQARYMLSGDVNRQDQTIRINVHLTDLKNGNILWSERYEKPLTDLFAIQDEVTGNIISNLSLTLTEEEKRRIASRYTDNLQAYDYFLRGRALINTRTLEDYLTAREMYKKAITLDPYFARAYSGLAMTYTVGYISQWQTDNKELDTALELSRYAISLDRQLPESYFVASLVNGYYGNTEQSIDFANQALTLNPNYADAYTLLAWNYIAIGEPQTALQYMELALHLNPKGGFLYQTQVGKAYYYLGNYELALSHLLQAHDGNPVFINSRYYLVVTYVRLGRLDEAGWLIDEMKQNFPNFNVNYWLNQNGIQNKAYQEKLRNDLSIALKQASADIRN